MLDSAVATSVVANIILFVLAATVHEYAHAWMANRLGDDTAAHAGRLTLNPLVHIDLLGTILLPAAAGLSGRIGFFGWAKPTPTNLSRVRRDIKVSTAEILVSGVGPLSNLVLGAMCAAILGLCARFAPQLVGAGSGVGMLLSGLIQVNAGLCVFNLLPIPPLDGGHVIGALIPYRFRPAWERFASLGPFMLIAVVMLGTRLPILSVPYAIVHGAILQIAYAIA
jgi:Zn-dependent protease